MDKNQTTVVGLLAISLTALALKYAIGQVGSYSHLEPESCPDCHMAQGEITAENASKLLASQEYLCKQCHPNALEQSHPSGFTPHSQPPEEFPLDSKGDLTCSTCHDLHGNNRGLIRVNRFGRALCVSCHQEDFFQRMADGGHSLTASGHADSSKDYSNLRLDQFSLQCMACHESATDGFDVRISNSGIVRHSDGLGNHSIGAIYADYASKRAYWPAASLPSEIKLPEGKVSCISCHKVYTQVHGDVVITKRGSKLCFSCHNL